MTQNSSYVVVPYSSLPPLTYMGMSLSSICGADCIYCPTDRGERIKPKVMPIEIAKKALDDVSSEGENIRICEIHFGENGDAFINKNALDIFRYAKDRVPKATRHCTTNLQNLSKEKIDEIVGEGLLNEISFNVDGATEDSFQNAKGITIEHVKQKLPMILEARQKYGSKMQIVVHCMTVKQYAQATLNVFGFLPSKLKDPEILRRQDDASKIERFILSQLRDGDKFLFANPFFWAERERIDKTLIDYSKHTCPLLARVAQWVIIASDGTWYACCYDSNNRLAFGSIKERSILEISRDEPRRILIERLFNRRFAEIGPPCDTVNCCRSIAGGAALI